MPIIPRSPFTKSIDDIFGLEEEDQDTDQEKDDGDGNSEEDVE